MKTQLSYTAFIVSILIFLTACNASSISTAPSSIGRSVSLAEMEAVIDTPGPIVFEKHLAARWSINLSGLLNLDHPLAIDAGLQDRDEPIELYVYSLKHPHEGTYLVDSGISERFINPDKNPDIPFHVKMVMGTDKLKTVKTTKTLLEDFASELLKNTSNGTQRQDSKAVSGVFITHIHLDHIMGLADLPSNTPVYTGPNEGTLNKAEHIFTQGTTDRLLANTTKLREWQFDQRGIIDVFGDASVFAIHSPGHTPGSTAYLVRTTEGPHLLLGDTTHTRWGWEHGVEPGTFSNDQQQSAISLRQLVQLSEKFPAITIHPGHQSL